MRVLTIFALVPVLAGCQEAPGEVTATASAPSVTVAAPTPPAPVAASISAGHGGTIVTAGPYPFEVVPHASGQVHAYLPPGVEPPAEAKLRVDLPVEGRTRPRPVRLRWSADEGRFEGRVRRVAIVPGPLEVHFTVHDEIYVGHVATIVIAPAIVVHVEEPRVHVHRRKHKHRKHHMRRKHHMGHGHGGHIEIDVH